jgi:hypothetical protein
MTEKDIIFQLKSLQKLQADETWVNATRSNLLQSFEIVPQQRVKKWDTLFTWINPRYASYFFALFLMMILGMSFTFVQQESHEAHVSHIPSNNIFISSPNLDVGLDEDGNQESGTGDVSEDVNRLVEAADNTDDQVAIESNTTDLTVMFQEDSDSKDRFKRMLKDRVEVKVYNLNQQIEGKDEQVQRQIMSILDEVGKAFQEGELIEALELVTAAEKLLTTFDSDF